MKAVFSFVLLILAVSFCALAQDNVVKFEPVAPTLDGQVYFLSLGPSAEAETNSELGIIKGQRALRVMLSRLEMSHWISVESVFFNRAGGARVEWCAVVGETGLREVIQGPGSYSSENFSWVDATTFEFYDDVQAIEPEKFELVEKPRRLRFHLVSEGVFEVSVVVEE